MTAADESIAVVGSGYVGTTLAASLAEFGHEVIAIDIDQEVVDAINDGRSRISEPGLDALLEEHAGHRLRATTDHTAIHDATITFLAVETPARDDGSLDATALLAATEDVGAVLSEDHDDHLVVVKSTVLPDVIEDQLIPTLVESSGRTLRDDLDVAVNPEFLREGTAVADLMDPDRIVIGTDNDDAGQRLEAVYAPLVEETGVPVFHTGRKEASIIKYANNAYLATKLSYINELGGLCKSYGVDTYEIADGLGLDARIGEKYLRAGLGWGGSCLPKDTAALRWAGIERGHPLSIVEAAIVVNDRQPERLLALLRDHVDVDGERVAVLGLAFKPETDDIRSSRAIPVIEGLIELGAEVVAYDPNDGATDRMRERIPEITYVGSAQAALTDAIAACVVTDWDEFAELDDEFDAMARPLIIDGRRIVEPASDIEYVGLSW